MRTTLLVVLLFVVSPVHAQTQTVTSSTPLTCSSSAGKTTALYCYGVQADGGRTIWLDWYPNGYNNNPQATHGFVSYSTPNLRGAGTVQGQLLTGNDEAGTTGTLTLDLKFSDGTTAVFVAQLEYVTGLCGGGRYTYQCPRTIVASSVTTAE